MVILHFISLFVLPINSLFLLRVMEMVTVVEAMVVEVIAAVVTVEEAEAGEAATMTECRT